VVSAKPKKLSFHATKVTAEVEPEEISLAFEVERDDGEPSVFVRLSKDAPGSVGLAWGDGKSERDDAPVAVTSPAFAKTSFRLDFVSPDDATTGPYKGIEITFDELEEEDAAAAAEAFAQVLAPPKPAPKTAGAAKPGAGKAVVGPDGLTGHRKRGNPQLGVLATARTDWRMKVGEELTLELMVSNTGGAAEGISIDIGGAALAHIEVRDAAAQTKSGTLDAQKTAVRATLAHVRVDPDYDIDRKAAGRDAPAMPKFPLTVTVRGKTPGQALLTVRVTPRTADGRGSAMVGRTIFVEA
jgi:hypothetical protein